MIFHPLHCSTRKVNTCYKTWGEAGPAQSCPSEGREVRGMHLCQMRRLFPILQIGKPKFREVKPPI